MTAVSCLAAQLHSDRVSVGCNRQLTHACTDQRQSEIISCLGQTQSLLLLLLSHALVSFLSGFMDVQLTVNAAVRLILT